MVTEGVDFSWGRPGGKALVAAGKTFVVRYVPYDKDGGKGLTIAEVEDYRFNGLDIALVFEITRGRALNGYAQGVADAKVADAGVASFASLGMPQSLPVYFAVDVDVNSTNWPAIDAYMDGCASVIGRERVGVYSEKSLIDHLQGNGKARWFWQTYAWSGGVLDTGIHLYQYRNGQTINGASVDYCRAYQEDFGQWRAGVDIVREIGKAEDWTPTKNASGASNGVLRAKADVSAPILTRVPLGTVVRSLAEVTTSAATDNNWRRTQLPDGSIAYMLRRDWNPLVQGGDPAVSATLSDFVARKALYGQGYVTAAIKDAVAQDRAKARIVYDA